MARRSRFKGKSSSASLSLCLGPIEHFMARTKSENYDSKRIRIMTQAARLFAEQGFAGASMADISKACGVSKSLIYHYYEAKEDILYGVMQAHMDQLGALIADQNYVAPDAREEFQNLTTALLECYGGAEHAQKVLLYELNHLTADQRDDIIKKQRQVITRFEMIYKRIKPELANDKAHLRARIMLFFGMINWTHNWYDPSGVINRRELAAIATDTVLGQDLS